MKQDLTCFFASLIFCSCNSQTAKDHSSVTNELTKQAENEEYKNFELYYSYAGLGSGMGSMQPTFRIAKNEYIYTFDQNSFYTKPDRQPETKCKGKLRESSIDSIINLVKEIKDSLIYKTNSGIMSGGIHKLSVTYGKRKLTFQLHNAYDSTAQKILDILNSNIPDDKERLWLFHFPEKNKS